MSGPVVSLRGSIVPQAAEPLESVIATLRRALEMAEAGEIQGVAVAMFHADGLSSWDAAGVIDSFAVLGAISAMRDAVSCAVRGQ